MVEAGKNFVSPTGYVDLDNDCAYSIDLKSTRSREYVNPKEDLAFYFQTYIQPKYGLENLNVSNVASFMKDLEMNWSKLTPELKSKVLDIMVDGIFNVNYDFKQQLLQKLKIDRKQIKPNNPASKSNFGFEGIFQKSNFGLDDIFQKSNFGGGGILLIIVIVILAIGLIVVYNQ
jgi:hypothetical protein